MSDCRRLENRHWAYISLQSHYDIITRLTIVTLMQLTELIVTCLTSHIGNHRMMDIQFLLTMTLYLSDSDTAVDDTAVTADPE